jgi:hypothetical protein
VRVQTGPNLHRGLSLAEACLAIAQALVIAYLPLSQLFHLTSQQTVASRNQLVAQQLACNLFELYPTQKSALTGGGGAGLFRSADLLADAGARTLLTGDSPEVQDVIRFAEMKMKVEIEPGFEKKPLDRIEVVLSWKEGGHPREVAHARLIAR